jgi:hypothetical protein
MCHICATAVEPRAGARHIAGGTRVLVVGIGLLPNPSSDCLIYGIDCLVCGLDFLVFAMSVLDCLICALTLTVLYAPITTKRVLEATRTCSV